MPSLKPQQMIQRSAVSVYVWSGRPLDKPSFTNVPRGSRFERAVRWMRAVCDGLRHEPYLLTARQGERVAGILPLALVRSFLFGRFLVSLPYVNSAGVLADDPTTAGLLVDRAVALADELDVRYLELRHEAQHSHVALSHGIASKVHMRLPLPATADGLWRQLHSKVRNQVRKAQSHGLSAHWGREELLDDFYAVFSHNMRDLGTPVYGRRLFAAVLDQFAEAAEISVVRLEGRPVAAAVLVHAKRPPADDKQGDVPVAAFGHEASVTEVPSASSLRPFNHTNANMLLYWGLLCRAIERGQTTFDFGRSSVGSSTYRFKEQWGARLHPAVWQYYVRKGRADDMRPDNGKYALATRLWRRLPLGISRLLGPHIVRGIP